MGAVCYSVYGITPPKHSDLDAVYNSYQSLLANMMLMSTLILGFVMTGTLLTALFDGDDNYGAYQLVDFIRWTVASGMSSLFALVLSFLVHARGVDVYTRRGASKAVRAMKRNLIPMLFAETALYAGLLCFGYSVGEFIGMQYVGPDICPYDRSLKFNARPQSFCARVSADFYGYSKAYCSTPAHTSTWHCKKLKQAEETSPERVPLYYVWDMASPKETQTFEQLSVEVAEGFCKTSKAAVRAEQACQEPLDSVAKQQACASATMANQMAADCADDKLEDATKCRKVCALVGGSEPGPSMQRGGDHVKQIGLVALAIFGAYRVINQCAVSCIYQYEDIKTHGCVNSVLNMVTADSATAESTTSHTTANTAASI